MGLFDAAGSAANATPYGAAANAALQAIATPNTSQSGDISSGLKSFGNFAGGINFGSQIPTWVWVLAGVTALWLVSRKRGR